MKQAHARRGAATIHPGVAVSLLVFFGLMAWALIVNWNAIDPRVLGSYGMRERAVNSTIMMTLLIMAVAGGVAATAYFVFGKSMQAANIGIMVVVLLGSVFPARRVYLLYEAIDRRAQQVAASERDQGGAYVVPNPIARNPQPSIPSVPPSNGMQPSGNSGSGRPATATTPVAPVLPPPSAAPAFDDKPVLDPLRAELGGRCEAIATKAEAAFAAAARPRKVNQFLKDSIAAFASLKADADALETELRTLHTSGTREALERGGAPTSEAMGLAMDFDREFHTFERQVACGEISRFAEKAGELFTIIKENFAKVQIDTKGQPTSKDRDVETKLFHARSQVGFAVSAKDKTLGKLRGN